MRLAAVVLLLALASLVAGCGAFGDGRDADVESAIAAAMRSDLDAEAPLVQIRAVDCTGSRPDVTCRVDLGVGSEVVQVGYAVTVGADGCWEARATRAIVIGAGTDTNPLEHLGAASDLKGCLR